MFLYKMSYLGQVILRVTQRQFFVNFTKFGHASFEIRDGTDRQTDRHKGASIAIHLTPLPGQVKRVCLPYHHPMHALHVQVRLGSLDYLL